MAYHALSVLENVHHAPKIDLLSVVVILKRAMLDPGQWTVLKFGTQLDEYMLCLTQLQFKDLINYRSRTLFF